MKETLFETVTLTVLLIIVVLLVEFHLLDGIFR
jgi:hypothetical protein